MPTGRKALPLWARAADACAIALAFLALYVAIEGGFVFFLGSERVSIRSEWRVLVWVLALFLVRHGFVRDQPLHRRIIDSITTATRAAGPLRQDRGGTETPAPGRRVRFYAVSTAAVVGLYVLLTAVMTYPQARYLSDRVSMDEGDALFSTWRLAWVAHQLPRDPLHLFDANIFHPDRLTLAFSDAMIFPALMAAPLLWLGVHQLLVYNIIFLSGFALSGAGMFLLVRSLTGRADAAVVAGFVFAFLPYRFMHYAHLELQMAFFMPLCLWALHRTIRGGRVRDGVMTGVFFALQCLCSWYYGIFLATFLIPVGLALLVGEGHPQRSKPIKALVCGGLVAALIVVPMAVPYFEARQSVGERPEDEIEFYSATPQNYLAAHPRNATFGALTSKLGGQERELFMGFVIPLIALVGLWPPLSASRIAYAIGLVVAFDLSLGFNGVSYPWLHAYVLPYRGLRVPARMAMLVGLSLAVLAGYGAARLLRMPRQRYASYAVLAGILVLAFAEYRSTLELKRIPKLPPAIYEALPTTGQNVLLELPLIIPDISLEPVYMYFSTFKWYRLVNGYSGFKPPSYDVLLEAMAEFPDDKSIWELRRRGVSHVVVHERFMRRGEYLMLLERIEGSADLEPVTTTTEGERETRLYRLRPAQAGAIVRSRYHQ